MRTCLCEYMDQRVYVCAGLRVWGYDERVETESERETGVSFEFGWEEGIEP